MMHAGLDDELKLSVGLHFHPIPFPKYIQRKSRKKLGTRAGKAEESLGTWQDRCAVSQSFARLCDVTFHMELHADKCAQMCASVCMCVS